MKTLLVISLLSLAVYAKTLTLEICTIPGCYTQVYHKVKSATELEDAKGKKYVRMVLEDGRLLDVMWATILSLR